MAESKKPLRGILSVAKAADQPNISLNSTATSAKQVSFCDQPSIRIFECSSEDEISDQSDNDDQSDNSDNNDNSDSSADESDCVHVESDPLAIEPGFVPMQLSNGCPRSPTPEPPPKRGRGRPRRTEQTVRGPDGKVAAGCENRSPPPQSAAKCGRSSSSPVSLPKLQAAATVGKSRKQSMVKRSPTQLQLLHFKLDHLIGHSRLRKRQLTRSFGAHVFQAKVRLRVVVNMEDLLSMHVDEVAQLLDE